MAMERVNGGACGGRGGPKDVLSASHAHGIDGDHGQAAWKYRRPSTRQSGRTTAHATESRTARALVPHSCATARCSEQARRKAGVRDAIVTGIGCADIAEIAAERVWQAKCRASGGGTNKAKSPMSPMDTEVAGATETCASKIASGHIGGRRGGRAGRAPKDGEVYRRGAATLIFVDLGWSSPIRKIRCDRAHRSSRIDVQRRYVARAQGRTSRKSQQAVTEVGGCAER